MVSPTVIAMTGWTTEELDEAITAKAPASNFDLVTLLIGVNNQYRKRSINTYALEFHELLKRAIGFANGNAHHVLVISIPDWGVTPFGKQSDRKPEAIGKEIDAFNAINKKVALQMNAQFIDITPISRTAAQDNTLLAEDGLHPSGKMYAAWVSKMMGTVLEICKG